MTLDEFIKEMRDDVDHFERAHKALTTKDPRNWPDERDEADWWEHFDTFRNSVDE